MNLLYLLLQKSFGYSSLPFKSLSHTEYVSLMSLARKQTVDGMVAGVLIRENVLLDRIDAFKVFTLSERIRLLNEKVSKELTAMSKLLSENAIPHLIFKGQTISTLYPHRQERLPGDIDFYVDKNHFDRAKTLIMAEWGVKLDAEDSKQHYSFTHNNVLFELHYNMMHFFSSANQQYWDNILAANKPVMVKICNTDIPTLAPTLNLLYTFLHMYHHLVELGVGFRHFCDLICLLQHYHKDINRTLLDKHLTELGFRKAFIAIGWILVDKFNLPKEMFPIELEKKERKYVERILKIVLAGGNFGKDNVPEGFRSGGLYFIRAFFRKINHYRLFWKLSAKEIKASIMYGLPEKIRLGIKHI